VLCERRTELIVLLLDVQLGPLYHHLHYRRNNHLPFDLYIYSLSLQYNVQGSHDNLSEHHVNSIWQQHEDEIFVFPTIEKKIILIIAHPRFLNVELFLWPQPLYFLLIGQDDYLLEAFLLLAML